MLFLIGNLNPPKSKFSHTKDRQIRRLMSTLRLKNDACSEYIVIFLIFYKRICVKCVISVCQKRRRRRQRRNECEKKKIFFDRKFASLMIHSSAQMAYKYHYPSSNTQITYNKQHPVPPFTPTPFLFDNFTCFSHVKLNFTRGTSLNV